MSLALRAGLNIAYKAVGESSRVAWAVLLILVARWLGGEALGRISFAHSFASIVVLLADLGATILLVREVARDRASADRYLGNLLAVKLLTAPVTFAIIAAATVLSGYPPEVVAVVLLFGGIVLARGVLELYGAAFSGLELMAREATLKSLHQGGLLIGGGIALALGSGPVGVSLGLLVASLLVVGFGSAMIRRTLPGTRVRWEAPVWGRLLRQAVPIGVVTGFLLLCNEIDIVLLSYLGRAEREIGWYAAASKILRMLHLIPMLVVSGFYPVFSDLARGERGPLKAAYTGALKLLLIVAIPMAIVVGGLAQPLMRAVYGDGFAPAATPLRLLAASIPLLYLGYVLINVLVSSDRPALAALASGVAGGVTIAGNVLLIPVWGIAGSAIAAILAQASLVLVGAIATDRAVVRSAWLGLAAKPVAAGAAMLVTVALIGSAIGVAAFAVGLAVYVLALAASGALREEDVVAVRRLWRRARLGMTLRS